MDIGLGAGPGSLIGICTGQSATFVASLLAVHKAGAPYVPLDPEYPADLLPVLVERASIDVILTTSQAEQDILASYRLRANAFVTKPVDLEQFLKVVQSIEQFWLEIVKLSRP